MYNLIGNSCVASYITRDILKQQYINPFCWSIMDFKSCYNLVENFDDINFKNIELTKDANWNFSIIIDKIVKIDYVHYIFSKDYNEITIKDNDVMYNKIWEYIIEKYKKRIKFIRDYEPIFIFATANNGLNRHKQFTLEEQLKLDRLNTKYKIFVSFKNNICSDNINVIQQNKLYYANDIKFSKFIFENLHLNAF